MFIRSLRKIFNAQRHSYTEINFIPDALNKVCLMVRLVCSLRHSKNDKPEICRQNSYVDVLYI